MNSIIIAKWVQLMDSVQVPPSGATAGGGKVGDDDRRSSRRGCHASRHDALVGCLLPRSLSRLA